MSIHVVYTRNILVNSKMDRSMVKELCSLIVVNTQAALKKEKYRVKVFSNVRMEVIMSGDLKMAKNRAMGGNI